MANVQIFCNFLTLHILSSAKLINFDRQILFKSYSLCTKLIINLPKCGLEYITMLVSLEIHRYLLLYTYTTNVVQNILRCWYHSKYIDTNYYILMYQLLHGAECNMRDIFRVLFVSVIFHEPKASEIQKQKEREKYFHIARNNVR